MEDKDLQAERAVMDDHEDKVRTFGDGLGQLLHKEGPAQKDAADLQQPGLLRRLTLIEAGLPS